MSERRCFICGVDWGALYGCRLAPEGAPDDWITVHICDACWEAAERRSQARLRERERQLLATWPLPLSAGATGDERIR